MSLLRLISVLLAVPAVFFCSPGWTEENEKEAKKEPPLVSLEEVVVTATRSPHLLKEVPLETSLISREEIEDASVQTLTDAIRWVPGVNISGGAPFGAARRFTGMIRGLPAHYSLVLLDGRRIKSEHIHTGLNLNLVPIHMVERIEVVKGPASVLYGSEAFGGVINVITGPIPDKPMFSADASYGTYDTTNLNLAHGYSPGKWGYFLSANLLDTDGVKGSWYTQGNVLGKLRYRMSESDDVEFATNLYRNEYFQSNQEVNDDLYDLSLEWTRDIAENALLKSRIYHVDFKASRAQTTNRTSDLEVLYQGTVGQSHYVTTGLEVRHESFERLATPHEEETIPSVYFQDEIEASSAVTPVLALRVDHHPEADTVFTPKVGALCRLTSETNLRASVGRGFRAPSLQDLYEHHYFHRTFWRDGNPDLKPEYAMSFNLGVEHQFHESLLARVSGFRNEFSDMIAVLNTGRVEDDGLPILRRENITTARTQGIETEIRYALGGVEFILGHTFLDTEDDEGDVLSYTPEHLTSFRVYYDIDEVGLGFMLSVEDARQRYYKDTEGDVNRLDDYALLSFNIRKTIGRHASLFFRIENILDDTFEVYEEGKAEAGFGRAFIGGGSVVF